MDELISKRAVIEAIEKARANVGHNLERSIGKTIIEILDDVGRDINGLSSALGTNLAQVGTDLISRQAAIDALLAWMNDPEDDRDSAFDVLMQLPPIQPKRGKWIEDKGQQTLMKNFIERGEVWRVCSVCGAGHMIGHKYAIDKAYHDRHHNFCPNCGADMREVTT